MKFFKLVKTSALAIALVAASGTVPLHHTSFTSNSAHAAGPQSVADLADSLLGAVVNISTSQNVKSPNEGGSGQRPQAPDGSPFQDFFDDFFKDQDRSPNGDNQRSRKVQSLGSGFVIDPKGIIITNNHVIADADEITIEFADRPSLTAEVIGKDSKTDIAVLKVNPTKPLQSVPFGDSSKSRVGDWVMAIGNPLGQGRSVTLGIVSAINRDIRSGPYDSYIQTDAAINKGNSGGPLFNMDGEVIGINTAIISPSGGSIGLGFSVPSKLAVNVISQLREFGETRRGWLGVSIQPVTDDIAESLSMKKANGALVAGLTPKGPAKKSGVLVGDVILKFDGKEIKQMRDLPRIVAETAVGKAVDVIVFRKGKEEQISVTLGRLEDGEKLIAANKGDEDDDAKGAPKEPVAVVVLGMTVSDLTDEARAENKISEDVKGVLITAIDPASQAAEKLIKVGSVISEVGQESVSKPADITNRLAALKKEGRKKGLFLIADTDGQLSFIVLNLE